MSFRLRTNTMAVTSLFAAVLLLCVSVNALESPESQLSADILRRIEELEHRDKLQQYEIQSLRKENSMQTDEINTLRKEISAIVDEMNTLRKENSAMSDEISLLKVQGGQLTDHIADMDEHERSLKNTLKSFMARFQDERPGSMEAEPGHEEKINESLVDGGQGVNGNITNGVPSSVGQSHDRTRQIEQQLPAAFFATVTRRANHLGINQPIVFDNVITNVGHAYHSSAGIFTVPVSGIYVFSSTIMVYTQSAHFEFAVNGKLISRMFTDDDVEYGTTSQTIVLSLSRGDDVSVRNADPDKMVYEGHYSSFSGFLLIESSFVSNTHIVG